MAKRRSPEDIAHDVYHLGSIAIAVHRLATESDSLGIDGRAHLSAQIAGSIASVQRRMRSVEVDHAIDRLFQEYTEKLEEGALLL